MSKQVYTSSHPMYQELYTYYNKLLNIISGTEHMKEYTVDLYNRVGRCSSGPVNGQYKNFPETDRYSVYKSNNKYMLMVCMNKLNSYGRKYGNRTDLFYYKGSLVSVRYYCHGDYGLEQGNIFYIFEEYEEQTDYKYIATIFKSHVSIDWQYKIVNTNKVALRNVCKFFKMSDDEIQQCYKKYEMDKNFVS